MPIIHTMKRMAFHLTEKQIKILKELSQKTGLKFAELIRRAIDNFIKSFKSVL